MKKCPCGNEITYEQCCGKFIKGQEIAQTPSALMRSRYTAYATADIAYIIRTMKAPALDHFHADAEAASAKSPRWVKLRILNTAVEGDHGTVTFQAYYIDKTDANKVRVLHEISQFRRDQGIWYYIDGTFPNDGPEVIHLQRNDLCVCGSQKKFKKCCGNGNDCTS